MATPTKTIRLRPKLRAEIERIARRTRRSFSQVAQALLDEALRMHACPGIYFADEPTGRVAKVAGTGLGVWEFSRIYKGVEGNETKIKKWMPHVSSAQLKAAVLYYAKFPQEVETEIATRGASHRKVIGKRPCADDGGLSSSNPAWYPRERGGQTSCLNGGGLSTL